MINSMTGFGRGEVTQGGVDALVHVNLIEKPTQLSEGIIGVVIV